MAGLQQEDRAQFSAISYSTHEQYVAFESARLKPPHAGSRVKRWDTGARITAPPKWISFALPEPPAPKPGQGGSMRLWTLRTRHTLSGQQIRTIPGKGSVTRVITGGQNPSVAIDGARGLKFDVSK